MNGRYETDDLEEPAPAPADREISLGTGAMLAIFFALVVVCGAFFGFGYSMGHKATPVAPISAAAGGETDAGASQQISDSGTKAGSGGAGEAPTVVVKPSAGSTPAPATKKSARSAPAPLDSGEGATTAAETKPTQKLSLPVPTVAAPAKAVPAASATPTGMSPAAIPGSAPIYVQISAVSHQEDAQLLTTALKRRGYDPAIRHSPQDQLLHIQLGPFATKKEADAMRQRLSADGYNAILK